jgi:carbonic anhydrase
MDEIQRLIKGFQAFRKDYFEKGDILHSSLKDGQHPETMIIACSDSRVDPAILTGAVPGEIFVVRNVANLVPPFEESGGKHGVSAALEFGVCYLNVEQIIVMGHSGCGGIDALMKCSCNPQEDRFISSWMSIAVAARDRVLEKMPGCDIEARRRATEQDAILISLENLCSFPFINARVKQRKLELHGWYFDLSSGDLLGYNAETGTFINLSGANSQQI